MYTVTTAAMYARVYNNLYVADDDDNGDDDDDIGKERESEHV